MSRVFKIATWNVNSIRIRSQYLSDWLQRNNIDIALLQELKCRTEDFPFELFENLGYNCYVLGQKSYNGVAILSKFPADEIKTSFENNPCADEARFIEISTRLPFGYTKIRSIYVPNGGEVNSSKFQTKLEFLDALNSYLQLREFDEYHISGGDFNVAPDDRDVFSPKEMAGVTCFTIEEREKIRSIKNTGLIDPADLIEQKDYFTWWDYRAGCFQRNKGLRIDYFLTSPNVMNLCSDLNVDIEERAREKASDHAPVTIFISNG